MAAGGPIFLPTRPPRGAWVNRWTFSPPLPPPLPSNLQICQRPLTIETDNMGSLKCDIVCQNFWKRTATNTRSTGTSTGTLRSWLPRPHQYYWGIESHRSKYSSTGMRLSEAVTLSSASSRYQSPHSSSCRGCLINYIVKKGLDFILFP